MTQVVEWSCMDQDILKKIWKKGLPSFLICAFCFLYLLKFSWLKWGDLIIDTGRDLYAPLEILSGRLLYRDMQYFHGPFSPYFNAFLFKMLGAHINSLVFGGVITTALASILIYKISRLFLNISFSTFTVLTFLFVLAFGQYVYLGNYNFILPFAYPATHSILFSLAALYFFYRSFFKIKSRNYISSLFTALVFLCRVEIGLLLVVAVTSAILIYGLSYGQSLKKTFYHLLIYIALPLILAMSIYGFLIGSLDILMKSNLLGLWANNMNTDIPFVKFHSGTYDTVGNVLIMFKSAVYYLLLSVFFAIGGGITAHAYRSAASVKRVIFIFLIGLFFIGAGIILFRKFFNYDLQYRILPVICLLTICISFWRFFKDKDKVEYLFLGILSFFSLSLLTRKLFYVWAGHYGFYLLVPGIIVYYVFFLKIAAGLLNSNIARRFFTLSFLCVFTLFIISHFVISRFCYLNRTLEVSTPRGNLYVFNNDREKRNRELIEYLRENTAGKESLVIFPEGLTINFLSERRNPLYYNSYVPLDIAKPGTINTIISDMEAKRVDYVALVQRDTSEFGYYVFGQDYGEKIREYIVEKYVLYKQFGPFPYTSQEYGIALFKRK